MQPMHFLFKMRRSDLDYIRKSMKDKEVSADKIIELGNWLNELELIVKYLS